MILDINPGEYITIEPDDDIYGSLNIFCNCFYEKDNTFENVINFERGYYSAENCEYIEIINVANNLFVFDEEHSRYWSGIFRILSQSNQYVKDIYFENINVDWTKGYMGKAFHIEIRNDKTASYTESKGYEIENIVHKNISFFNCSEKMQKLLLVDGIKAKTNDGGISDIVFDNVTYNGVLQSNENIETDI